MLPPRRSSTCTSWRSAMCPKADGKRVRSTVAERTRSGAMPPIGNGKVTRRAGSMWWRWSNTASEFIAAKIRRAIGLVAGHVIGRLLGPGGLRRLGFAAPERVADHAAEQDAARDAHRGLSRASEKATAAAGL